MGRIVAFEALAAKVDCDPPFIERDRPKGTTMSDLQTFAKLSCEAAGIYPDEAAEILTKLTSKETKLEVARKLVEDARTLFQIPEQDRETLAGMLADPQTRRGAEIRISHYPYADPKTQWVGIGYSLILDAIFAEDEPLAQCYIVAVPAHWGSKVWHSDRDLTDDGYQYRHWVYTELPYIEDRDRVEPVACVLVSENVSGVFHWGNREVCLYRGEITIRENHTAEAVLGALTSSACGVGV